MTRRCAYLTMENTDGWSIDAELGFPPMEAMGWTIESLPWRKTDADWDRYDAVYIGTPWDYPENPGQFMQVLQAIDRSRAVLVNDLALVSWAMPKTYLKDLEQQGVAIVPSDWHERLDADVLDAAFGQFGADNIIVKPVIGTNATDAYLLDRHALPQLAPRVCETFAERPCVIQPFIGNIRTDGEYSLFYFSRQYSHAIRKIPEPGDYRVQEERGADIVPAEPQAALRAAGDQLLELVDPLPVYARADFVRGADGRFLLMELELVEPSMYLRMDADAPRRFAKAFDGYVRKVLESNA